MDKETKAFREFNKARREAGLLQVTFSNYKKMQRGTLKVSESLYATSYIRPSPKVPSGDGFGTCAPRKEEKHYTGGNLLGIATMHKSNSVPVFRQQDAEDIARMRR